MFGDFLASSRHALHLLLDDAAKIDARLAVLGVALYLASQALRSRGWHTILRAAFDEDKRLSPRHTCRAYLAGAGLNSVIPARGGDVAKLALVHRRLPDASFAKLAGTFVPETAFETLFGTGLVVWALIEGLLPIPVTSGELPSIDVTLVIEHPIISTAAVAAVAALAVLAQAALRRRAADVVGPFRAGMAIFHSPRRFVTGVASWQALARLVRLGSLAAFMAAFSLPVTASTVVLVMAAQGGGRIVPLAPVSGGLRLAMLSYGFGKLTGGAAAIGQITAFTFGVGAILMVSSVTLAVVLLMLEFRTASPFAALSALRARTAT